MERKPLRQSDILNSAVVTDIAGGGACLYLGLPNVYFTFPRALQMHTDIPLFLALYSECTINEISHLIIKYKSFPSMSHVRFIWWIWKP